MLILNNIFTYNQYIYLKLIVNKILIRIHYTSLNIEFEFKENSQISFEFFYYLFWKGEKNFQVIIKVIINL